MFTYIIWSPQGEKPPTSTFSRRWAAENEAKRLSLIHPNQVFHVCKIKSSTVAGQSAYFGKWRPKSPAKKFFDKDFREFTNSDQGLTKRLAVSECDLMDEDLNLV